ncbi:MAG TPA: hypothetical protein VMR14_24550 [Streptosporangiaceae bacterium]|nr:hypothetical protein [Streptosporangiaceae bacterium]
MDIEDSIIDLTDAIGNDYTDLAPEGEAHFDPVTLATLLACHILYAVGAGIKEGITEAAKDGTVAVLQASGRHISERLVPQRLRDFFSAKPDEADKDPADQEKDADADRATAEKQASDALAGAAFAAGGLDPTAVSQLAAATAVAVAQALQAAGLKETATIRVEQTIKAQVSITLTPAA